ncbi:MAG: hypothetical protein KAJ29_01080 [Alphaproteobacteria bacterium]|nr:hypothetical protein [Alphaproteobacteria bacterium]
MQNVLNHVLCRKYAMLHAACNHGWLDYDKALMETTIAFNRSGCNWILTYAVPDIVKLIMKE